MYYDNVGIVHFHNTRYILCTSPLKYRYIYENTAPPERESSIFLICKIHQLASIECKCLKTIYTTFDLAYKHL